jgi:hypothetical protein
MYDDIGETVSQVQNGEVVTIRRMISSSVKQCDLRTRCLTSDGVSAMMTTFTWTKALELVLTKLWVRCPLQT